MYHYKECGLQDVWLSNGYIEKDTPYGKAVSIVNIEGLHRLIGLTLVNNKPRLTGAEVRFLRKEMDLSQDALAGVLGVSETSVRAWESHRTKIPKPTERLLRVLYKESFNDDSGVRKMLDRIAHLSRELHVKVLKLSYNKSGNWTEELAA